MLAVLLLMQLPPSLLVRPMYLAPEPPEARSLRGILVLHEEAPGAPASLLKEMRAVSASLSSGGK